MAQSSALKTGQIIMKFNLNAVTRRIEKQISISFSFVALFQEDSGCWMPLPELYTHVRAMIGDEVTAGLFNKVIDDMSRIGLLRVDRKTKRVVDVQYQRLVYPAELKTIGGSSQHPVHQTYQLGWDWWQPLAQFRPFPTSGH